MPEISVIMGVYNQFNIDILLAAIDSILKQNFSDFEFIIYDDGSDSDVADTLRMVSAKDSRIKLLRGDVNSGLAFSLNTCINVAKGEFIARMDADDISYPNRFSEQIAFLKQNPEYSWVGTNADLCDEKGVWGVREMPEFPTVKDYLKYSPYIHPTVMYRASVFDSNQGYPESEETLRCEDYEIFMRLRAQGLKGANIQKKLFCYREDEESYKRRTVRSRINEAKCRYRNFKRLRILFPTGWLYVLRPIAAIIVPRRIIARIKRKEFG